MNPDPFFRRTTQPLDQNGKARPIFGASCCVAFLTSFLHVMVSQVGLANDPGDRLWMTVHTHDGSSVRGLPGRVGPGKLDRQTEELPQHPPNISTNSCRFSLITASGTRLLTLNGIRTIEVGIASQGCTSSAKKQPRLPDALLMLHNGDCCPVAWTGLSQQGLNVTPLPFCNDGSRARSVPRGAVRAILPGYGRPLLWKIPTPLARLGQSPAYWSQNLPRNLDQGELQVCFSQTENPPPSPDKRSSQSGGVSPPQTGVVFQELRLRFAESSLGVVLQAVKKNGVISLWRSCEDGPRRQISCLPLPGGSCWKVLAVSWEGRHLRVALSGQMLATVEIDKPPVSVALVGRLGDDQQGLGPPEDLRAPMAEQPPKVRSATIIAELRLLGPSLEVPIPGGTPQDRLTLLGNNRLHGNLVRQDFSRTKPTFQVHGAFGQAQIGWEQVHALEMQRQPTPSQVNHGWLVRVVLRRSAVQPLWPGFGGVAAPLRLTGFWQQANQNSLTMLHPHLGKLEIAWECLQRVEVLKTQQRWTFSPGPWHLGDEARVGWAIEAADGTDLSIPVSLQRLPSNNAPVELVLETLSLETPLGPFRKQLLAGGLITEVFLNGHSLGTLNRARLEETSGQFGIVRLFPTEVASGGSPQRTPQNQTLRTFNSARVVRLRVPPGVLRQGKNTLRLRQQPGQGPWENEYDDLLFGSLRLEQPLLENTPQIHGPAVQPTNSPDP